MQFNLESERETEVSRKSPGIFGYLNFFQSNLFITLLLIGLPLGVGIVATFFNWLTVGTLDLAYIWRDGLTFLVITLSGTIACLFFRDRTPLFNPKMAYLLNAYGTGMFAISYMFGLLLTFLVRGEFAFVEIFFILGAIISYIVLFVLFFSFTNVGPPWYIFLALIQPVVGILIYSFFSFQVTLIFFIKAMIVFVAVALGVALFYGPAMAYVSLSYRKATGIGGYHFIRAFVESLLTENHDDAIERYFEKFGAPGDLKLQYIAFQDKETQKIKGLFIIPNVHFGPFKTAGSSALAEHIYQAFPDIPGLTIFHTTVTHAQNFTIKNYNHQVINQIKDDMQNFKFETPEIIHFVRRFREKTKILGTIFNKVPFLMYTMHPFPTDDINPDVGEKIKKIGLERQYKEPIVVDCHNSLIGDEILITNESSEAAEMYQITTDFFDHIEGKIETAKSEIKYTDCLYSCARDLVKEVPISSGIGAGGIIVHLFKIGGQETALIHVDGNNALTPVRSAIINLGENSGLDRIEFSTSDTHAVVRILSSQGYYPIGTKISAEFLVEKIKVLIIQARKSYSSVKISNYSSTSSGYRYWKSIEYFDVIIETIQRCLNVSKLLLSFALVVPLLSFLLITLFFY